MNIISLAKQNKPNKIINKVSQDEGMDIGLLCERVSYGQIVIPANPRHEISKPCGIGTGLRTKVNANIGASAESSCLAMEKEKLLAATEAGAHTVMDLSLGPEVRDIRKHLLELSQIPLGTVPVYQLAADYQLNGKDLSNAEEKDFLSVVEEQAKEGVDFMTIHSGVTRELVNKLKGSTRIMKMVSRGGALMANWILKNSKENPYFEYFDELLDIALQYEVTLSLGDGFRPGSINDASDSLQLSELYILGQLVQRAREKGVQVIVEGPGHMPLDHIPFNMRLEKQVCSEAPFYVLGPLVTDIGAGYDHIVGAIGGAVAAQHGADFLCYVTASEHLRLPNAEDVREGVIASLLAAHAADIVKLKTPAFEDQHISKARANQDWKSQIELSLDPQKARTLRESSVPSNDKVCTMCGQYCPLDILKNKKENKQLGKLRA